MSANAIFILDLKGRNILSRTYRSGVQKKRLTKKFVRRVINQEYCEPVFTEDGISFVYIQHNNLYFLMTTKYDSNAIMLLSFLDQLVELFKGYFETVEEESIKDNFVVVYELLDEVLDYGYPQTTDQDSLKEFIKEETFKLSDLRKLETITVDELRDMFNKNFKKLKKRILQESENTSSSLQIPKTLTGVKTRKPGIIYEKNEVFLDVVESVNMVVSAKGNVVSSSLVGTLNMRCFLSGYPQVKLGLNDKVLFENLGRDISTRTTVDLDDIKFHHCVSLSKFEKDRTIIFEPPDGDFVLMEYRLNTRMKPLFNVKMKTVSHSASRISYTVFFKTNFTQRCTAANVDVFLPVPNDCEKINFHPDSGKTEYLPSENQVVWNLKNIKGKTELKLSGDVTLPSIIQEKSLDNFKKKPIKVNFKIPYYSVSKLQVRYLKVIEKSGYTALPLCRYLVKQGDYQIRQVQ